MGTEERGSGSSAGLKSGQYSKYTPAEAVALQLQSKKLQVLCEHSFLIPQ